MHADRSSSNQNALGGQLPREVFQDASALEELVEQQEDTSQCQDWSLLASDGDTAFLIELASENKVSSFLVRSTALGISGDACLTDVSRSASTLTRRIRALCVRSLTGIARKLVSIDHLRWAVYDCAYASASPSERAPRRR